MKFKQSKRF